MPCVACGHAEDADCIDGGNIRSKTLAILVRRRDWLDSHPHSANQSYLATRRSLASRRTHPVLEALLDEIYTKGVA